MESGERRLRLGAAEWLAALALCGAFLAWAFAMHRRLVVVETVVNRKAPRISAHVEELARRMDSVIRIEARMAAFEQRLERIEEQGR